MVYETWVRIHQPFFRLFFVLFSDIYTFRGIWMLHNFWLAKPYGLSNQKLCFIQMCNFGEKDKECSWEWLVNTDPGSVFKTILETILCRFPYDVHKF